MKISSLLIACRDAPGDPDNLLLRIADSSPAPPLQIAPLSDPTEQNNSLTTSTDPDGKSASASKADHEGVGAAPAAAAADGLASEGLGAAEHKRAGPAASRQALSSRIEPAAAGAGLANRVRGRSRATAPSLPPHNDRPAMQSLPAYAVFGMDKRVPASTTMTLPPGSFERFNLNWERQMERDPRAFALINKLDPPPQVRSPRVCHVTLGHIPTCVVQS